MAELPTMASDKKNSLWTNRDLHGGDSMITQGQIKLELDGYRPIKNKINNQFAKDTAPTPRLMRSPIKTLEHNMDTQSVFQNAKPALQDSPSKGMYLRRSQVYESSPAHTKLDL